MAEFVTLLYFTLLKFTLVLLTINKCLDECISGLSVQTEGVFQGLQFWTLVEEGFLETVASCMEVQLDGIESRFKDFTLLR